MATQQELLRPAGGGRVAAAAEKFSVWSTEERDLPVRFRKRRSRRQSTVNEESEVEKRFAANVESWRRTITTMIDKLGAEQAWKYIDLQPGDSAGSRLTDDADFQALIDYLILRRDVEGCEPDELGGISYISVWFQAEVEKRLIATP
jgi:hypothetical protein